MLSAATHAAIFLLVLFIATRMPPATSSHRSTPGVPAGITWIPAPHPGGGRDDGGTREPDPPRRVEAPGRDSLTVTARRPVVLEAQPSTAMPPDPRIDIPALATAAGLTEMPGVIAPTTTTTISPGSGSGPSAGDGRRRGIGRGAGDGVGDGLDKGSGAGNGVSQPRLIREIKPNYSNAALQARIQGIVMMQAVVLPDGTVGDVWIARSLDRTFGLDEEAIRTVKQWRFLPAMQGGRPVAVVVPIEMQFTIR